jgi:hypothetical protein
VVQIQPETQPKPAALTDVVCVSAGQLASRTGGGVAILDVHRTLYYGLDAVGARIWGLIEEPTPLTDVLAAVVAEFDIDEATATSDLLDLVDQLVAKGLATLRGHDGG